MFKLTKRSKGGVNINRNDTLNVSKSITELETPKGHVNRTYLTKLSSIVSGNPLITSSIFHKWLTLNAINHNLGLQKNKILKLVP